MVNGVCKVEDVWVVLVCVTIKDPLQYYKMTAAATKGSRLKPKEFCYQLGPRRTFMPQVSSKFVQAS